MLRKFSQITKDIIIIEISPLKIYYNGYDNYVAEVVALIILVIVYQRFTYIYSQVYMIYWYANGKYEHITYSNSPHNLPRSHYGDTSDLCTDHHL